jgi:hypothetical protein
MVMVIVQSLAGVIPLVAWEMVVGIGSAQASAEHISLHLSVRHGMNIDMTQMIVKVIRERLRMEVKQLDGSCPEEGRFETTFRITLVLDDPSEREPVILGKIDIRTGD